MFSFRKVEEELEAKFAPVGSAKGEGRLERKKYGDGSERLKIKLKDLNIADGSKLFVRSEDRTIAELNTENGRAKLDIESPEYAIPKLEADTEVAVSYNDAVILMGSLYKD